MKMERKMIKDANTELLLPSAEPRFASACGAIARSYVPGVDERHPEDDDVNRNAKRVAVVYPAAIRRRQYNDGRRPGAVQLPVQ